jgi:hypothetical protein
MAITELRENACLRCRVHSLRRLRVFEELILTGEGELATDTIWICKCESCGAIQQILYSRS